MDSAATQPFCINDWHIDPSIDCISRNGATVRLEPKHMQVLLLLAQHAGEIVSIRRIEDAIWGDAIVSQNALHQAIAQLRRSLEDEAKTPRYIQTVSRRGYRLIARVRAEPVAEASDVTAPPAAPEPEPFVSTAEESPDAPPLTHPQSIATRLPRALGAWKETAKSHWKMIALTASLLMLIGSSVTWKHLEAAKADGERARADEVSAFMLKVFSSNSTPQQQSTARQLADDAVHRIMTDLKGQPALQADMLETIGFSYVSSGVSERGMVPLQAALDIRRSIGSQHEIAETLLKLGTALRDTGRLNESERAYLEVLEIRRATTGERTSDYASALSHLANVELFSGNTDKALVHLNHALELYRTILGPRHSELAPTLTLMNSAYVRLGNLPKAELAAREALAIYEQSVPELEPNRIITGYALGENLYLQERIDEANEVLMRTLDAQRKLYGTEGRPIAQTLARLSDIRFKQGHSVEGEKLNSEAVAILAALGESGDEQRGRVKWGLAVHLLDLGQYARSEQLLREAIDLYVASSNNKGYIANAEHFLAETLIGQGRFAEAESLLNQALVHFKEYGSPQWTLARSNSALGEALYKQGRIELGRKMIVDSHAALTGDPATLMPAKRKSQRRMRLITASAGG